MIHEGDAADALYILQSGQMAVEAGGRGVATLGAGSWFGEIGLLESVPRTATVRTTERSTVLRIDGDAFLAALTTAPLSSTAPRGRARPLHGRARAHTGGRAHRGRRLIRPGSRLRR